MKKKMLTITILALALCMAIAFVRPVMAQDVCTDQNCAGGCQGTCNGEECTAECCPVLMGEKCYPTLEAAVTAAQEGETITLRANVAINKMLEINKKNVTLDLGGKEVTASASFDYKEDKNASHIINVSADGVTVENGTIKTTTNNRHGINAYHANDVVLKNLTIDHRESLGGAPVVVNGSSVEVQGNLNLIFGENSWYGIDIDPKDKTNASLNFADKSSVSAEGNGEKPVLYKDPITDEGKTSSIDIDGNTEVAIKDGNKTTYYIGITEKEVAEKVKSGSTITVIQGKMAFENLPDGVTVKIEEGAKATVNGYEVTEAGVNTTELNKEPMPEDKDNTPKTGSVDVALIATVIAMVSVAGIVAVKKHSK